MVVKNVVFDIGNVLVKWQPTNIITNFYPNESLPEPLAQKIFKSEIWIDLNLGKITEREAVELYNKQLNIPIEQLTELMLETKYSLTPVEGAFELLDELYSLNVPLYSITDNVKEIVTFLKKKYSFFDKFIGIAISAELGVLKPSPVIYNYLIDQYSLMPEETVFIDDLFRNVEGARMVGMKGIHFTTTAACRKELKELGIKLQ